MEGGEGRGKAAQHRVKGKYGREYMRGTGRGRWGREEGEEGGGGRRGRKAGEGGAHAGSERDQHSL